MTQHTNTHSDHKTELMQKLLFALLVLIIVSCKEEKAAEFSLSGKTSGIEDGTVLILEDIEAKKVIDSAVIENNAFVFHTKLPSSPTRAVFQTKDYSHYRYIWLENNPMTFDASKSDFRNAPVTGSETEALSIQLSRKTDTLDRAERQKVEQEFVRSHPNSLVSANILSIYSVTWGKEITSELFALLSRENKESDYARRIKKFIELNRNPKVDEPFVDFEMKDIDGSSRKLSEFENKLVLLEFWASWCGPCRRENPNLVKTYEQYHPKGFEIFAVSMDENEESWKNAIEKDGLNWTHVSDLKGRENTAGLIYGINGIPDNFLIDRDGRIVARNLRGEELNEKLAELTSETGITGQNL